MMSSPVTDDNRNNNNNKKMKIQQQQRNTATGGDDGSNESNNEKQRKSTDKKISHALSWALRHGAIDPLNLTIAKDGYVPVDEILSHEHKSLKCCFSLEAIRRVVDNSDKQRFKLQMKPYADYYRNDDNNDANNNNSNNTNNSDANMVLCVRANQGHSFPNGVIDPNLLLTELSRDELAAIPTIVHGTYNDPWNNAIQSHGLNKMNRTHIHFATGLPSSDQQVIISGMRKSCQIYVFVNPIKCANDNIVFYRSDNDVLLTNGLNDTGVLPPKYFSHVTDAKTGKILLDNRD